MNVDSLDDPTSVLLQFDDGVDLVDALTDRGWGDGLPVVAPTPERVDAMLAGYPDHDPDEVIATLPPRFGEATRRTLAINAVMAGCRPEHLPVLETAVRALAHPELNLRGVNATTHCVAPLVVVHGEVARSAGYHGGLGAFGPCNRANATTGRAVRLVLLHVAGATPGDGDASTQGSPAKYGYCVAENSDASPWPAYPTTVGVNALSAVTVHCGEAPHNVHDMESDDPARILDKVASAMATTAQNNACISRGEYLVALCPEHAATCAEAGWSRRDVTSYLFERARLPAGELRRAFALRAWAPWMDRLEDDAPTPMTEHPDNIRVMVVGGPGKHSSVIPSWGMTRSVTLPVLSEATRSGAGLEPC